MAILGNCFPQKNVSQKSFFRDTLENSFLQCFLNPFLRHTFHKVSSKKMRCLGGCPPKYFCLWAGYLREIAGNIFVADIATGVFKERFAKQIS